MRRAPIRVRAVVEACARSNIEHLTIFAFQYTKTGVGLKRKTGMLMMNLFSSYLQKEVDQMEENGVRLIIVA
jgi:undecaprenyl diphosphate synthase